MWRVYVLGPVRGLGVFPHLCSHLPVDVNTGVNVLGLCWWVGLVLCVLGRVLQRYSQRCANITCWRIPV